MNNEIETKQPVAEDQAGSNDHEIGIGDICLDCLAKEGLMYCDECHQAHPLEGSRTNSALNAAKKSCIRNFIRCPGAPTVYPAGARVVTVKKSRPRRKQSYSAVKWVNDLFRQPVMSQRV
jgi:hypothetical protein